jgi:hypothetical protein
MTTRKGPERARIEQSLNWRTEGPLVLVYGRLAPLIMGYRLGNRLWAGDYPGDSGKFDFAL